MNTNNNNTNTALATTGQAPAPAQPPTQHYSVVPQTVSDLMVMAEQFARSGYFKDAGQVAQAVVKIQYGKELGIGPAAAMMGIHVVQGKPTLSASLIAARIKSSGKYNYRIVEHTEEKCVVAFFENGESVGTADFTIEQARKASLANKDPWKFYPKNMLFSRAISNGAKLYCADVFLGPVYTPEEMGAEVDEAGEVVRLPDAPQIEPPAQAGGVAPGNPDNAADFRNMWAGLVSNGKTPAEITAEIRKRVPLFRKFSACSPDEQDDVLDVLEDMLTPTHAAASVVGAVSGAQGDVVEGEIVDSDSDGDDDDETIALFGGTSEDLTARIDAHVRGKNKK